MTGLADGDGGGDTVHGTRTVVTELLAAHDVYERRAQLQASLDRAIETSAVTKSELESARTVLDADSADVRELESMTTTRIWASLNGSRAERLRREQAERDTADLAYRSAERADSEADAVVARLRQSIAELGDVDERRRAALDAMEVWLLSANSPAIGELRPAVAEIGSLRAELGEVQEAVTAVETATARLQETASWLLKAGDWSTYDTFFGGGIVGDAIKYDRIDHATAAIAVAEESMRTLSAELSDIGMATMGGVDVSSMTSTLDVWFDNIFSDMAVRGRIEDAASRVDAARDAVARVSADLAERRDGLTQRVSELGARREQILLEQATGR